MSAVKRLFWSLPFLFLAMLLLLTFFQHPSSDDFAGNLLTKTLGLRHAITWYLSEENGRFSSIPLFLLLTSSRFLLDHYYICLIFFLLLSYWSVWHFLRYVLDNFYTVRKSKGYIHWLTAFSLLLLFSGMPEPSSFFSWLATDATYLIAFVLFLFYLTKLHQVIISANPANKGVNTALLIILVCLISGTNEIALSFSFFFSLLACSYRLFVKKERDWLLFVLPAMHILIIAIEFCSSGNIHRSGAYVQKQFWMYSLTGAFYQALQIYYAFFSNALFWLAAALLLYNSRNIKPVLPAGTMRGPLMLILIITFFFVAMVGLCFIVRHLTGIILPYRARNLIVCVVMPSILASIVIFIGPLLPEGNRRSLKNIFPFAGIFVILFNPLTSMLMQSLADAPVHKRVLDNRRAVIKQARAAGKQKAVLLPYKEDFQQTMTAMYGKKTALFFKVEFPGAPRLLYFLDDASQRVNGGLYGEYYGIDSIQMGNNVFPRLGLLPGVWRNEGRNAKN